MCFDCSGFVYYYFLQIGKWQALEEIKQFVAQTKHIDINQIQKIYAAEYVDFLKSEQSSRHWQPVDPLHLQHGDLIVYAMDGKNRSHSHCMLVDQILKSDDESVMLAVVDSTKTPHANDTRSPNQTGIGRGTIILYPHNGKCNSFLWGKVINHRNLFFTRIRE